MKYHWDRERTALILRWVLTGLVAIPGTASTRLRADDKTTTAAGGPARVQLSEDQARAIAELHKTRPEKPAPLFLFTDPNKDPDDLSVLVITKYLQEQGFVDLRCVVTTLGDKHTRFKRAKFVRSVLDHFALEGVAVGVGGNYSFDVLNATGVLNMKATAGRRKDHAVFIETPLLSESAQVDEDGPAILKRELARVPDHSAVWLINCGMVDSAALLREAPELVKQKVAKVVIMGGIEGGLDESGFVVADKRAYNNSSHQPSADSTYRRVQELQLPLVVVNKEAAYAVAAPRSFYDGMAATGHPVGVYLRNQQREALKHLWEGIHKGHLPAALTPTWFFKTFTDLAPESEAGKAAIAQATATAEDFEGVWSQVSRFNLYDPLALLAATPGAAELLFRGHDPQGVQSKVRLIDGSSIADPTLAKDLLAALAIESLNPPSPKKSRTGTAPEARD